MSKRYTNKFPTWAVIALVALALVFLVSIGSQLLTLIPTDDPGTGDNGDPGTGGTSTQVCTHTTTKTVYEKIDSSTHYAWTACASCDLALEEKTTAPHVYNGSAVCACGYVCAHPTTGSMAISKVEYATHTIGGKCSVCGTIINGEVKSHTFANRVCTVCDYECEHEGESGVQYSNMENANQHLVIGTCGNCDFTGNYSDDHTLDTYGACTLCEFQCAHENIETVYTPIANTSTSTHIGYHIKSVYCPDCGYALSNPAVACTYAAETGLCELCAGQCPHNNAITSYADQQAATHDVVTTCGTCGYVSTEQDLAHNYVKSVCSLCGYTCAEHEYTSKWTLQVDSNINYIYTKHGTCVFCKASVSEVVDYGIQFIKMDDSHFIRLDVCEGMTWGDVYEIVPDVSSNGLYGGKLDTVTVGEGEDAYEILVYNNVDEWGMNADVWYAICTTNDGAVGDPVKLTDEVIFPGAGVSNTDVYCLGGQYELNADEE